MRKALISQGFSVWHLNRPQHLVGESRFELLKRDATDLQSAPFGHSGTLPYKEPPFKRFIWSWWTDSNPRPADYKSAALPTELHQLIAVTSFSTRLDYYISKISICQHFFTIFSIIKRLTLKKESLINLS